MLVLIDESGDPGFKLDKGSTRHFVVALVLFKDFAQAEACSKAIHALRISLGISGEFKFNKTSAHIKDEFFQAVKPYDFEVWALVADKTVIRSENLRRNDHKFYGHFIKSLLNGGAFLQNARVKIDGSGDREFKQHLQNYLRRSTTDGAIASVKFSDSGKDNLIQLADMVVGALARSYRADEERNKAARWRMLLGSKLKSCVELD
jgi:hypothetical protein